MSDFQNQNWFQKFANAGRGIRIVLASERSCWVHLVVTALVVVVALLVKVTTVEGMLLTLCIAIVLTAELLNTSIEWLARQVTKEESSLVRDSLDAAAGGVLVASLGAAGVGACILLPRIWEMVGRSA